MSFINPWLLLGLLGVAAPILIHLLNRFRFRETDWAAMELLRKALKVRSRRIKLEDLLLLILRCLAVLLIALALARPTLRHSAFRRLHKSARVGVMVAIDGSMSMAHRAGVTDRFSRAIERAREIFATVDAGDPVTLVLMGSRPRILARNMAFDPKRTDEVLKGLAPLAESLNLEPSLKELETLVGQLRTLHQECYLITDAQRVTWNDLSGQARQSLRAIAASASLFLVACGDGSADNVALTRFEPVSGFLREGGVVRYGAEVRNFGSAAQESVIVSLSVNGVTTDQRVLEAVPPASAVSVPLFVRFDTAGTYRVAARLERPDPLALDNSRYAVTTVPRTTRILCVDGDPADNSGAGETVFLRTALQPGGAEARRNAPLVRVASWLDLGAERFEDVDIVVLANVPDLGEPAALRLRGFVERGGGLVVFAGDKMDPAQVNARMGAGLAPLSPAQLNGFAGDATDRSAGWHVGITAAEHPVGQAAALLPADSVAAIRIHRYARLALLPGARMLLSVAENGQPLLAEKQTGAGRVLFFAVPADRDWANLVAHPLYPILLHTAAAYLARRDAEQGVTAGEPLVVTLPADSGPAPLALSLPDGSRVNVQVSEQAGVKRLEFRYPELPGFYSVEPRPGQLIAAAVNVPAPESDVTGLDPAGIRNALGDLPVTIVGDAHNLAQAVRESRVGRELWRTLLGLGLALLLTESALAHWFSRRQQDATGAPAPLAESTRT